MIDGVHQKFVLELESKKMLELLRGELRSRTEAKKIYMRAKDLNSPCVRIDFKDVYFMSRSF